MNDYNMLGYFSLAKDLYGIDEVADTNFGSRLLFSITEDNKFILLFELNNENGTELNEIFSADTTSDFAKLVLNTVNLSDPVPGVYQYSYSTKELEKLD